MTEIPTSEWIDYGEKSLAFRRKTAPDFEDWATVMASMDRIGRSIGFWRGDLYIQGELWYGEANATAIFDDEGWDLKTIQNNASVCRRIPPPRRREEPWVTYSHHAELAYIEPDSLQDKLLEWVAETHASVRDLRDRIKELKAEDEGEKPERFAVRIQGLGDKAYELVLRFPEGEVRKLLQTAADCLYDAAEIQKDAEESGDLVDLARIREAMG